MRKVSFTQTSVFLSISIFIFYSSYLIVQKITDLIDFSSYRPIVTIFIFGLSSFILSLISYRAFLKIFPLKEGDVPIGSMQEFIYHIHLLFYLLFFLPVIKSNILPVPLMRLIYIGLGAKMGENSYCAGLILDSYFIEIGNDTLIGDGATLVPHALENEHLSHHMIKIGNNVTIGTGSRILPGVTIEDDAIVSANAVVRKNTYIKRGEIWGGVPAKLISNRLTKVA